jgi:hypothetical protein
MEAYHFMLCVQPHSALTARELLSVVIEFSPIERSNPSTSLQPGRFWKSSRQVRDALAFLPGETHVGKAVYAKKTAGAAD